MLSVINGSILRLTNGGGRRKEGEQLAWHVIVTASNIPAWCAVEGLSAAAVDSAS
jgi:hypothetical protein